jgi:hypothetical protein
MLKCLFAIVATLPLMLIAHPLSATNTAAVEVSLVIKDSCIVQQDDERTSVHTAPSVSCALGSPYGVQLTTQASPALSHATAPRSSIAITPSLWQVTF